MSFVIARQRDVKPRTLFVASFFIAASCAAADQGVTIESFTVPTPNANAASIAAAGNGDMWFVESAQDKLGKISPTGTITEIPIPADAGLDIPLAIAKGADDRLWFTTEGSTIGAVKTDGTFQKYQLVSPNDSLVSPVVSGSDNRLYFFEQHVNKVGAITTSGVASEYSIPTALPEAWSIAAGPDGSIWFTELKGNRIGRMTVSGAIVEFPLPTDNSLPSAITSGADGNIWFIESRCPSCGPDTGGQGETIGRITPSGAITEFEVPGMHGKDAVPPHEGIVAGPDGALWFTESFNNRIGRISTSGTISEFDLPADGASPQSIALSNDGRLWVAAVGDDHDHLYRITISGAPDIVSGMTGNWYDPNQSGHGFSIEVLPGNLLVAEWYTFTPSGEPTWIIGSGGYSGSSATLDAYQTSGSGAKFPPYFDAKNVQRQHWGTLTFTFSECGHGQVSWSSDLPNYGAGTMNLTQLTQPVGLSCP